MSPASVRNTADRDIIQVDLDAHHQQSTDCRKSKVVDGPLETISKWSSSEFKAAIMESRTDRNDCVQHRLVPVLDTLLLSYI